MSNRVQVKIAPVVASLTFDMERENGGSHGQWTASIKGHPGCIGDGTTKEEAIRNAVALYLHVLIMRIHRDAWTPQILKQDS